MLLLEMLFARLLWALKMPGCRLGDSRRGWSSGEITADHCSRDEDDDVDDRDDVEDAAGYKCIKSENMRDVMFTCFFNVLLTTRSSSNYTFPCQVFILCSTLHCCPTHFKLKGYWPNQQSDTISVTNMVESITNNIIKKPSASPAAAAEWVRTCWADQKCCFQASKLLLFKAPSSKLMLTEP